MVYLRYTFTKVPKYRSRDKKQGYQLITTTVIIKINSLFKHFKTNNYATS